MNCGFGFALICKEGNYRPLSVWSGVPTCADPVCPQPLLLRRPSDAHIKVLQSTDAASEQVRHRGMEVTGLKAVPLTVELFWSVSESVRMLAIHWHVPLRYAESKTDSGRDSANGTGTVLGLGLGLGQVHCSDTGERPVPHQRVSTFVMHSHALGTRRSPEAVVEATGTQ